MSQDVQVFCRVHPAQKKALEKRAAEQGLRAADIIRALILAYLKGDLVITPPVPAGVTHVRN